MIAFLLFVLIMFLMFPDGTKEFISVMGVGLFLAFIIFSCAALFNTEDNVKNNGGSVENNIDEKPVIIQPDKSITIEKINNIFSRRNSQLTRARKEHLWKTDYKGKCVEWTSTIRNIYSTSGFYIVKLKHNGAYISMNVNKPMDDFLAYKKGDEINYLATLNYASGSFITIDYGCK